jgi:hypothetical protein
VKLPNAERAVIDPRKIQDYLLSWAHPVGRFKAHFFVRLGFATETWQLLHAQLKRVALEGEAKVSERTDYGQKYIVRGTIGSMVGRGAKLLTVWIVLDGEDVPRFVTAYPER